jgi:hypothetical protein
MLVISCSVKVQFTDAIRNDELERLSRFDGVKNLIWLEGRNPALMERCRRPEQNGFVLLRLV